MCKTIGILGGMGPFATMDLFQKIILNTPAQIDQEHLKIIIYNNPKIPPRVVDVNQSCNSPLPELIKTAKILQEAGADFIIMPCHTAHLWINEIQKAISIPFFSIVDSTVEAIALQYKDLKYKKILLLATETTVNSGLYQAAFNNTSFEIYTPSLEEQKVVDQAIKNVKGGNLTKQTMADLNQLINLYYSNNVSMLVGCCTEIPLMFPYLDTKMDKLDPTLILAKTAIKNAI